MITLQHDRTLSISVGVSRKDMNWRPLSISVSELYGRFETPVRGTEAINEYLALPKSEQDARKDVGGFVGGTLSGPRRKAENVLSRDLVTLDVDNIPPYGHEGVIKAAEATGYGFGCYPTRKDRPVNPRLRFVFPTSRSMSVDEHDAVARKLAEKIGIEMMDPSTFEAHRLMYWPSCCSDSNYQFVYRDLPLVDVDAVLGSYTNWMDWNERPQVPGVFNVQKLAVRQGDPETKPGIVGAFNRLAAQNGGIEWAMEHFLPGIYQETDTEPGRYTYLNGSTTGGAKVYDNGKFMFSHHATDPCGGKLVSAFDMVRLHKFGEKDDDMAQGTPINRLPSYKAMCEFAVADPDVAALMAEERYTKGTQEFSGVQQDQQGEDPGEDDGTGWMAKLQLQPQTGAIKPTIDNILIILNNDPRLCGKFALNSFAGRGEVLGPLPWEVDGKRRLWSDTDNNGLYWYLEKVYNLTGRGNIDAALDIHAATHAFNDVQNYLSGLRWDGTPRLDTLFIDYLGAEDNLYNRTVCRKAFTAAVARAMDPGCKYDNMLILCGRQGIGKSTILDKMSCGWFTDNLRTFEGKDASELLQGVWLVEVAELDAFRRTEVSRIKQFLSLRSDRYRAAYGRNVKELPRCCVFFGTCNQMDFLQDMTGNRRFWPVDVDKHPATKNVWRDLTEEEIAQIWAEAKARWQMGETTYLTGEVEQTAQTMQEQHREASPKEGLIEEFVNRPVPVDWSKWPVERRRDWWYGATHGEVKTCERDRITALEIWCELYQKPQADIKPADTREINAVLAKIPGWKRHENSFRCGPYGTQRGFLKAGANVNADT